MQAAVVEQVNEIVEEAMSEVTQLCAMRGQDLVEVKKHENRVKSTDPNGLPEKQFVTRNSPLTEVFESQSFQPIRRICFIVLVILLLTTVADAYKAGGLPVNLDFFLWCFGGMWTSLTSWLVVMTSSLGVYGGFCAWAGARGRLIGSTRWQQVWDSSCLIGFLAFQVCFLYFPGVHVYQRHLPPPSALFIFIEQVRIFMKSYAFVRSNAPRVLSFEPSDVTSVAPCPTFHSFIYYHFCPTFVYQDQYPRVQSPVCWSRVLWNFLQIFGIIVWCSFVFESYMQPLFQDFGLNPSNTVNVPEHEPNFAERLIGLSLRSSLPSTFIFLSGAFFALQHLWLNNFAEMLQFTDRLFYEEWWNAPSYKSYYRRWNTVVHDFLYTYVFKDIAGFLSRFARLRFLPSLIVIFISAVAHEIVLALAFRFFYPVMFVEFSVIGAVFFLLNTGNLFVLCSLPLGYGLMGTLYCIEWYARVNCAQTLDDLEDFFTPRSWSCVPIPAASLA